MEFQFKRQIFGFMDLLRFKNMVKVRRKHLAAGSDRALPASYKVNETAKILHPGYMNASLVRVEQNSADTKTYILETEQPFYFRAGQYATLGCRIGDSTVSRPYAISSAPREALNKTVAFTVKKCGFFSGYLFDNAKAGDRFVVGDPSGTFHYEGIKDSRRVLAIAGGSGITPFYSMAQAVADGTEDFELTILYGAKTEADLVFKTELEALRSDKIKIVYVLSDEKKEGYGHGFMNASLISRYASGDFTVMMCGPEVMYSFLDKELRDFNLPRRRIKKEANCIGDRDVKDAVFSLTVRIGDVEHNIPASANETVLTSMERAGLNVPSKCRAGGCGFCHSKLINGQFTIGGSDKRRLADSKFGYIHPCCTYPDSDMSIIVPKA